MDIQYFLLIVSFVLFGLFSAWLNLKSGKSGFLKTLTFLTTSGSIISILWLLVYSTVKMFMK